MLLSLHTWQLVRSHTQIWAYMLPPYGVTFWPQPNPSPVIKLPAQSSPQGDGAHWTEPEKVPYTRTWADTIRMHTGQASLARDPGQRHRDPFLVQVWLQRNLGKHATRYSPRQAKLHRALSRHTQLRTWRKHQLDKAMRKQSLGKANSDRALGKFWPLESQKQAQLIIQSTEQAEKPP